MAAGIEVYKADGTLLFDSSSRLGRFVMSFNTGTSNGSQPIPAGVTGEVVPIISNVPLGKASPGVSVSGGSVVWYWGSIPETYRGACDVMVVTR